MFELVLVQSAAPQGGTYYYFYVFRAKVRENSNFFFGSALLRPPGIPLKLSKNYQKNLKN